MRSSPFGRLWRSKSLRIPVIALAMTCALNMAGCHGGRRTSMRPRFFTSTTRSQSVIVDQGYTTVESPGAIVQQQQGAIIQQSPAPQGGQTSEPPIVLEPRQGGTTSSIVPSFGDAQNPLDSTTTGGSTTLSPRRDEPGTSIIDNLAPPAEAPQVIMERPPGSNLDSGSAASSPIDSTIKRQDSPPPQEPRLEVIQPNSPGVKEPAAPAGSGGKEPAASKTSAWRNQPPSSQSGRITYQASARKNVGSGKPGDPLGIID